MTDIFFSTGSSAVKTEYTCVILSIGKTAAQYGKVRLRLEGHTDKVGCRDYNLNDHVARIIKSRRSFGPGRSVSIVAFS